MAEQRIAAKEKKEKELKEQYDKEQALYKTRLVFGLCHNVMRPLFVIFINTP